MKTYSRNRTPSCRNAGLHNLREVDLTSIWCHSVRVLGNALVWSTCIFFLFIFSNDLVKLIYERVIILPKEEIPYLISNSSFLNLFPIFMQYSFPTLLLLVSFLKPTRTLQALIR